MVDYYHYYYSNPLHIFLMAPTFEALPFLRLVPGFALLCIGMYWMNRDSLLNGFKMPWIVIV